MLKGTLLFVGGVVAGVFGCYAAKKGWYSTTFKYMSDKCKLVEIAVRRA